MLAFDNCRAFHSGKICALKFDVVLGKCRPELWRGRSRKIQLNFKFQCQ